MPILKRETSRYPDDLFTLSEPWWVAHVRSRQEKALTRYLHYFEVPFFLPLQAKDSRRNGRLLTSYLPLFPGYVFFRGTPRERLTALRSDLIANILDVPAQDVLDEQLRQLHDIQSAGRALAPHPYLALGDSIRITDGPFKGFLGAVIRVKSGYRLVVSISILQRSVAVELDAAELEKA